MTGLLKSWLGKSEMRFLVHSRCKKLGVFVDTMMKIEVLLLHSSIGLRTGFARVVISSDDVSRANFGRVKRKPWIPSLQVTSLEHRTPKRMHCPCSFDGATCHFKEKKSTGRG